jgi:hypothetical protein
MSASVFFSPVPHTLLWKAAQYSIASIQLTVNIDSEYYIQHL